MNDTWDCPNCGQTMNNKDDICTGCGWEEKEAVERANFLVRQVRHEIAVAFATFARRIENESMSGIDAAYSVAQLMQTSEPPKPKFPKWSEVFDMAGAISSSIPPGVIANANRFGFWTWNKSVPNKGVFDVSLNGGRESPEARVCLVWELEDDLQKHEGSDSC